MQQHLMQMQPLLGGYAPPNQVTTELIQQYLDENKQLILAILDGQSSGKADECAENQAKLQRNLMYLAAIADSQPQVPTVAQFPPASVMQSGPRYMQHQQAQQMMSPQSLMAVRSSLMYGQSPMSALQHHQQQTSLHSGLGMNSGGGGGGNSGFGPLRMGEGGGNGLLGSGIFPDFGSHSGGGAGKQDQLGSVGGGSDGRNSSSVGQNGDGTEPLYVKASEDGN